MKRLLTIGISLVVAGSTLASVGVANAELDDGRTYLTTRTTTPDLNCEISYRDDVHPAFYGRTACGTLLAVGDTLYGPSYIPAGGGASPRTPFTEVSQLEERGTGAAGDPWTVVTEVDAGDSGLSIRQTDTHIRGTKELATKIEVINSTSVAQDVVLYRAGDCYLADSDLGAGKIGTGWAACIGSEDQGRILQFADRTSGTAPAAAMQGHYADVWRAVGSRQEFPGTSTGDVHLDNGAGVSWNATVPAGDTLTRYSSISFSSEQAGGDRDWDGLPDEWEAHGTSIGGESLPLHEWGADPDRRDVFLQVNWMKKPQACEQKVLLWFELGCKETLVDMEPKLSDFETLVDVFAERGISLHVDAGPLSVNFTGSKHGGEIDSYHRVWVQEGSDDDRPGLSDEYRDTHVSEARQQAFHHMVLGDRTNGDNDSTGIAALPGDTSFVSMRFADSNDNSRFGTILHEFGHNFGLTHGGPLGGKEPHLNCKTDYKSRMNYLYQFSGGVHYTDQTGRGLTKDEDSPQQKKCEQPFIEEGKVDQLAKSTYNYDSDWDNLIFGAGDVGGFNYGSLYEPIYVEEGEAEHLWESAVLEDRDVATVDFNGRAFVIRDVEDEVVTLLVKNRSQEAATYDVEVTGLPESFIRSVTLGGGEEITIEVAVDTTGMSGGEIGVTALVRNAAGDVTSDRTEYLAVLTLSEEEARQIAQNAPADETDPLLQKVYDIARARIAGDDVVGPPASEPGGGPSSLSSGSSR